VLQSFIKRVIEREVFVPIIVQAGFNSKKADCLLPWGLPERSQITAADVVRLADVSAQSGVQFCAG
jgi:hypothetical protein